MPASSSTWKKKKKTHYVNSLICSCFPIPPENSQEKSERFKKYDTLQGKVVERIAIPSGAEI